MNDARLIILVDIIHFTTAHPRSDSRIRSKMVASLHQRDPGCAALYVQDGLGDELDPDGFWVIDTGPRLSRLCRMTWGALRMLCALVKARPRIAHFHDPELLPWAVLLRLFGIKVLYDVHEDYPEVTAHNGNLPRLMQKIVPSVVRIVEWVCARLLNGIVVVTPTIAARFPPSKTVMVRNFPLIKEFTVSQRPSMRSRPLEIAYIGTITLKRNILGMMDAVALASNKEVRLRLAGDFTVAKEEAMARGHPGWNKVNFDGWLSREGIALLLNSVRAGLVVIKNIDHEMLTYPIKLFEYMAAGVPVISSDFPLWREIVEEAECGILVDPSNPQSIAESIDWLIKNPDEAQAMGERGRIAVQKMSNWDNEFNNLLKLYEKLGVLNNPQPSQC